VNIHGLDGNDNVLVNVAGTDLVGVPITFDGGAGFDSLFVFGTPAAGITVNSVTYTAGPVNNQGRVAYDSTGTDMTIDFVGLEPVSDTVPAAALIVNGTNDDDTISYTADPLVPAQRGQVAVDSFETFSFANKTAL